MTATVTTEPSTIRTAESVEERTLRFADAPITFEQYLDLCRDDDDHELIDGVLVFRMSANLTHERLYTWLLFVLYGYAAHKRLGTVLGSRTAVKITDYKGRLPDLLVVRSDRSSIVQERAILSAPDLVIEIISPSDRPGELAQRQSDYQALGVPQMWFIEQRRQRVRIVRCVGERYDTTTVSTGPLMTSALPGFQIPVGALFNDQLPDPVETLNALLGAQP